MDVQPRDIRLLVESCRRNNMTVQEAHRFITVAWGQESISESRVYHLYQEFASGQRQSFDDMPRSGRPCSSATPDRAEEISEIVEANPHASVREIEDLTGIPRSTVHRILTEDLAMKPVCSKWIPHFLSTAQKEERVACAHEILHLLRRKNITDNLIIVDEKMIFLRSIGTKKSNLAWVAEGSNRPRVPRRMLGEPKRMFIVAVTFSGRFHLEVLQAGESVNATRYLAFLKNMEHNFRRHVNSLPWDKMHILHDNARPHASHTVIDYLTNKGVRLVKQPPLSPDYNLLDRFVFSSIESSRCGVNFSSETDLKVYLTDHLRNLCSQGFMQQFSNFKQDLLAIIDAHGDYL